MFCMRLFTAPCFMNNFFHNGKLEEVVNNSDTKGDTDGQTWRTMFKTVSNVVFESLLI